MPSLLAVREAATVAAAAEVVVVAEDLLPDGHSSESLFRVCLCWTHFLRAMVGMSFCSGLPPTGSWQDLKDHMREAGDVCYADVFKDGSGVVEFLRYDDMKYAVKKLDDSRFRSHEVCADHQSTVH